MSPHGKNVYFYTQNECPYVFYGCPYVSKHKDIRRKHKDIRFVYKNTRFFHGVTSLFLNQKSGKEKGRGIEFTNVNSHFSASVTVLP